MDEVVGEAVVVIDDQEHGRRFPFTGLLRGTGSVKPAVPISNRLHPQAGVVPIDAQRQRSALPLAMSEVGGGRSRLHHRDAARAEQQSRAPGTCTKKVLPLIDPYQR